MKQTNKIGIGISPDYNEDTMFQYAMLADGAYGGKEIEGYTIDPELSSPDRTTYIDKNGKAVVSFRGTELSGKNKWRDLGSDALIFLGLQHLGSRFKNAKKTTQKAIEKYGKENVSTTGHSLGGSQALYVNSHLDVPSHVFNPGISPVDVQKSSGAFNVNHVMSFFKKKPKSNAHSYITGYDPISMLSPLIPNIKTHIIRKTHKQAHSLKNFLKKKSGGKIKMISKWISHVKEYASKHSIPFKQALKEAKNTYQRGGAVFDPEIEDKPKRIRKSIDKVTFDVPLFIRLLEYAREDAKTDMDLHDVAEVAISIGRPMRMRDYKKLVGGKSGGYLYANSDAFY